jgi:hypothetical protein
LRTEHAEAVVDYSDQDLTQRAKWGMARAWQYGIELPQDVATFVALLFEISPQFFEQPQIRAVLNDPAIPAARKMNSVMDRATEADWDEASLPQDWPA